MHVVQLLLQGAQDQVIADNIAEWFANPTQKRIRVLLHKNDVSKRHVIFMYLFLKDQGFCTHCCRDVHLYIISATLTSDFPRFAPLNKSRKASIIWSNPSVMVSSYLSFPSFNHAASAAPPSLNRLE